MGNNLISPKELVRALQSNGGVSNTVTSLIAHDRSKLMQFKKKYHRTLGKFRKTKQITEGRFDKVSKTDRVSKTVFISNMLVRCNCMWVMHFTKSTLSTMRNN